MLDSGRVDFSLFAPAPAPAPEASAPSAEPRHNDRHRMTSRQARRAQRRAERQALKAHHARHYESDAPQPAHHREAAHERRRDHDHRHYAALRGEHPAAASGPGDATATPHVSRMLHHGRAMEQTVGECLRGFAEVGAAGGIHLDTGMLPLRRAHDGSATHWARDAGPALIKAGFGNIGHIALDRVMPGDAIVWGPQPGHPEGHVNWVLADHEKGDRTWVSDNVQDYKNPYGGNNYQVYRGARAVFDDRAPQYHYASRGSHGQHHYAEARHHGGSRMARHGQDRHMAGINPNPTPFDG